MAIKKFADSTGLTEFWSKVKGLIKNDNWINGSAKGSVRTINSSEEDQTYTIGDSAVAEGRVTMASGFASHAEGYNTTASGAYSHAEGYATTAGGYGTHVEGFGTIANGNYSHASGYLTIASGKSQTVIGKYNMDDSITEIFTGNGSQRVFELSHNLYDDNGDITSVLVDGQITSEPSDWVLDEYYKIVFNEAPADGAQISITYTLNNYAFIIGNGNANNDRSNALAIKWDGTIEWTGYNNRKFGITYSSDKKNVDFGWSFVGDGAFLALRSVDFPNTPGAFHIGACNGTNTCSLVGHHDGKLSWGGDSFTVGTDYTGFHVNNNDTNIDLGWEYSHAGAGAAFRGPTYGNATTHGEFDIYARSQADETHTKHLIGRANGELSWDGTQFTFGNTSASSVAIKYNGGGNLYDMITFYKGPDQYGQGIRIGGGGLTLIGGGDSSFTVASTTTNWSDERMIVSADQGVEIWSNCNSGASSAKKFIFDTSGNLSLPTNGIVLGGLKFVDNIGSGSTFAQGIKSYFDSHKSTIPKNTFLSSYSTAQANGSIVMGYFLNGYDTTPYGGFYVCNYNKAIYVGVQNGTYTQYDITKTASSDIRLKENIHAIDDKSDELLLSVEPINFTYKKDAGEGDEIHMGFSAQEVEAVSDSIGLNLNGYHLLKKPMTQDEHYMINYIEFIPMLVHLAQSQQKQIDELKQLIKGVTK